MFNHIYEDVKKHALECYPGEMCGLVINNQFIPKNNISPTPRESFMIARHEYPLDGSLQAVVHSHTKLIVEPSEEDMKYQITNAVPWGIIGTNGEVATPIVWFGNGVEIPPLIGRNYRSGPSGSDNGGDCYAIIKDYYYMERGIKLPEYPRSANWQEESGDLYTNNFEKAGFVRISKTELQPGDVVLMQIRSKFPNHGGVYLGNGLLLHHLHNKLSRRELINRYMSFITHYLRYDK
jgi:proteasome lid subunit RPN8/RPN11